MNKAFRAFRGRKELCFEVYLDRLLDEKNLKSIEEREAFMALFNYENMVREYDEELLSDYRDFCNKNGIEMLDIRVEERDYENELYPFKLYPGAYQSEEVVVPEFVGYVDDAVFNGSKVKRVIFNAGSAIISYGAFINNKVLEEIQFTDDFRGILHPEFMGCINLRKLIIGKNSPVVEVTYEAFEECNSLEELELWVDSMENVGYEAISMLPSLHKFSLNMRKNKTQNIEGLFNMI